MSEGGLYSNPTSFRGLPNPSIVFGVVHCLREVCIRIPRRFGSLLYPSIYTGNFSLISKRTVEILLRKPQCVCSRQREGQKFCTRTKRSDCRAAVGCSVSFVRRLRAGCSTSGSVNCTVLEEQHRGNAGVPRHSDAVTPSSKSYGSLYIRFLPPPFSSLNLKSKTETMVGIFSCLLNT